MIHRQTTSDDAFADLVSRARRHEQEALMMLYRRALPIIYRYVLAHMGQPDLVEDIVSDVFLVMVESIEGLRTSQEAGFYAWLLQIAQRKVARAIHQEQRSRLHQVPLPEEQEEETEAAIRGAELADPHLSSDPVAMQEQEETMEELREAFKTLRPEQKMVLAERFLADQSIEEIAQVLHKQPGAVRALQFRALGKLAERLGVTHHKQQLSKGGRHAT